MSRQRPHIIVTIADDHRYDALSGLGEPYIRTANLDRLMERGTCYRNAYIPGADSGAVCAPSRAMLHSGRTFFNCRSNITDTTEQRNPLPTLGERLREAGYCTVGVGKWHNGEKPFERSFDYGYDVFHGGMCPHFCVQTRWYTPKSGGEQRRGAKWGHSTDIFTSAAEQALADYAESDDDRPLFLYVAYTAPHDPRETHKRYHKMYPWQDAPLPESFLPRHPFDNGELDIRDEMLAEFPRDPDEVRMHSSDYAAILHHMDDGIGRVHAAAEKAGLTPQNTVVVHTADHGIAIGRHGLMGKQSVYDHSMRPPLIAAGPGFEKGIDDDRLCYMQDLYPTLLDAAGVDVPNDCQFQHLRSSTRRTHVGSAYLDLMRQVRDERFKLIRTIAAGHEHTQLFDLVDDPHETQDLTGYPQHELRIETLKGAMRDWQAWAGDDAQGFA